MLHARPGCRVPPGDRPRRGSCGGSSAPATSPSPRRPRGSRCTSSCAGRAPPTSWSPAPSASRGCSATCCRAGLASGKVIAVYSTFLDTITRRAIGLVFAQHPELSVDAFTWLSLGSNGRREAVPSSDVDSAVAFDDAVSPEADRRLPGRLRRGVRGAGAGRPQCGRPRRHRAARPVLPDQRRLARRGRAVAGRAGRAQRRDDDLPAGGRPPHPRRPRPPGGDPGRRRPARAPGHDAPAAAGVAVPPGEATRRPGHPRPPCRDLRHQGARPAARRQPRPLGRAERRLGRAAHHRAAAGGRRLGHAARRAGARPDRGVRGAAAAAAAPPAAAAPGGPSDRPTCCCATRCRRSTAA